MESSQTPKNENDEVKVEKPSPTLVKAQNFIATLSAWHETDRARLAQLKRNVGEPLPGRGVSWFYGVLHQHEVPNWNHDNYFLVATLFDLNRCKTPLNDSDWGSIGKSLRRYVDATQGGDSAKLQAEKKAGRRLQILIDADYSEGPSSELAFRIRQTIQWLNGQKIGLDYAQLLVDLGNWTHEDRFVQKRWSRDFYKVNPFNPKTSPDTETPNEAA